MEYVVLVVIGLMTLAVLIGIYKMIVHIKNSNHYSYQTAYDEEGMEIETVVDWSDTTTFKKGK